ncbi:phage major capsid protein [Clostridium sp. JN-9]|uniref:phage major capsid protein n=1 Tax=Clostridium sp. JN-9 TaxID=2507159 RepID=UPI000FFE15C7|nr:phage major capsid protein [Clostridium sp. JN-9]QAT40842.1 phage major capsid protein [Clostridium sp. JN-9]
MAKMTQKEFNNLVNKTTEGLLNSPAMKAVINKIDLSCGIDPNNPNGTDTKEVKTVKYFKALMIGDMATAKDLSGGISDQGETLLPTEFQNDIIDRVIKQPLALRSKVTIVPVGFRSGTIPTAEGGVVMQWSDNDSESKNKQDPKFNNLSYKVHRLDGYTALSKDMISDTPIAVYNFLLTLYADAFVKAENTAILCGAGSDSNQPEGIRANANIISAAVLTGGKLVIDDLISMPYSIASVYRQGSIYIAGTSVIKQMRLMKDLQGRPLWADNSKVTDGQLPTFNGFPVEELDGILPENLGTGHNETEVLFGNFKHYYLFDRGEMSTEINTTSDTAFFQNRIIVKVSNRLDGKLAVPKAFVKLTGVPTGKAAS